MSFNRLTTGTMTARTASAGTGGEAAKTDALIADVLRPRFARPYRYVKKGPRRSIFRFF